MKWMTIATLTICLALLGGCASVQKSQGDTFYLKATIYSNGILVTDGESELFWEYTQIGGQLKNELDN